jgi:conjugative relaxase-like TrwC/TraI family protein
MLSITLPMHGVGHANHYIELAQKDYYTAQGNAPGAWFGRGAAKLGLTGEVDSQAYAQLLWGRSPDGRRELVQNAGDAQRQTAWVLTFSAPKSVSVLWALGSDDVHGHIKAAHRPSSTNLARCSA